MKILISSHVFYPNVGGIELISSMLAQEFINKGHKVKLVTQTLAQTETKSFPYEVIRQPTPKQLLNLVRWCDVFFHNNISLQTVWPLLIIHRPWVVAHRTWIRRADGSLGWQDYLKRFVIRYASCISISQAVADHVSTPSVIIGNPYLDKVFYEIPEIPRDKELVFVGRLVFDKGVDLLITALGEIKKTWGLTPHLTIIGEGSEESSLLNLAKDFGISNQVKFVGFKTGTELAQLLNAHQIMVVPSRWSEPFGIVALEGIACGCVVVGSEGGGLKDAIGPCGVTFPNEDVQALTQTLTDLLSNPDKLAACRAKAHIHLTHHKSSEVANAYLKVIVDATK